MCAFKPDEVHVKQFSWRLRIAVVIICITAVLLLLYLTVYSFVNLNPLITIALFVVLIMVVGIVIFAIDTAFYREIV
jgi:uncharacterized membrane protein